MCEDAPLLGPLPTPPSWGEEEGLARWLGQTPRLIQRPPIANRRYSATQQIENLRYDFTSLRAQLFNCPLSPLLHLLAAQARYLHYFAVLATPITPQAMRAPALPTG